MKQQNAFTLVELSIVLVMIGLLIGAVTAGMNMLHNANIASVVSDIQKYKSAHESFRDRFGSLAGDMPDATSTWNDTANGNGNGQIGPWITTGGPQHRERFLYWQHLQKAGYINGNYTGIAAGTGSDDSIIGENIPESAVDGVGYYITDYNDLHYNDSRIWTGIKGAFILAGRQETNNIAMAPAFYTKDAEMIDRKLDDALPAFGAVTTFQTQSDCNTSTSNANTADYNFAYTQPDACTLVFSIR